MSTTSPAAPRIVDDAATAPRGWDEAAVRPRGGHVMQGQAWAEYRRSQGTTPRYLTFDDGRVALASLRRSSGLPGLEAAIRRGPAHGGDGAATSVARMVALAAWAREQGARALFVDPERDADPAYAVAMDAAGFAVTTDLEPSIHVMRLVFEAGADASRLMAGFSKATRQRVRAAQAAGTEVRFDEGGERLPEFVALLRERADVLGIPLQRGGDYLRGWQALLQSDLARLLVALHDGVLVGGLYLYRHGGIWATAYSADMASRRRDLPGTMHLVRWSAIRAALEDGATAIELGGVDLPGHREPPRESDPNHGLYEHKRGFGATWVTRSPARRIVLRPWADRAATLRRRGIDALRGVRR